MIELIFIALSVTHADARDTVDSRPEPAVGF